MGNLIGGPMSAAEKHISNEIQQKVASGEISKDKVQAYERLVSRVNNELLPHPVITNNEYSAWFAHGEMDVEDVRHFLVQFSVFSNLFLEAQLKKVINSPSIEAMRASKEILLNELGVVFRNPSKNEQRDASSVDDQDKGLVEAEGTVEGGKFHFRAAHFEWLLRMNKHVGLEFDDVGKRKHGTKSTLFFCDELSRIYGSSDGSESLGASFAVENWANAGFWKELISGLTIFKKRDCPDLPIGFFTWHDQIEDQHAQHTWEELEEDFFGAEIDEDKFINAGIEMLDGVKAFWDGLNDFRNSRNGSRKVTKH